MNRLKATKKIEARLAAAVEFVKASKHPVTSADLAKHWVLAPEYVALFLNEATDQHLIFSDKTRLPHIYSGTPLKPRVKPVQVVKHCDEFYADIASMWKISYAEARQRAMDVLGPHLKPRG